MDDRNETGGDWQLEFFAGQCPTYYDEHYSGPTGPSRHRTAELDDCDRE